MTCDDGNKTLKKSFDWHLNISNQFIAIIFKTVEIVWKPTVSLSNLNFLLQLLKSAIKRRVDKNIVCVCGWIKIYFEVILSRVHWSRDSHEFGSFDFSFDDLFWKWKACKIISDCKLYGPK